MDIESQMDIQSLWGDISGNMNSISPRPDQPLTPVNPATLTLEQALEYGRKRGEEMRSKTIGVNCGRTREGPWQPCHKNLHHEGGCAHRSSNPQDTSVLYASTDGKPLEQSEADAVILDSNGRPLPKDRLAKGYEYCSETGKYEHNSILVAVKGHGNRVIWPGKGDLGFIYYKAEGFTVVRVYETKKKLCLTTKYFDGNISKEHIRQVLFEGVEPSSTAREIAKSGGKPYKATFRHTVLSKDDFEKRFKPNLYRYASYTNYRGDDTALKSLGEILRNVDGGEVEAGHVSAALNNVMKRIRAIRQEILKTRNKLVEWPCVEVYAVWTNYDMDASLIYSNYDSSEPLFYMYNVFNSPEEMNDCAL